MIQFEMKRFQHVARWDMTINRKFYLNQAAGLFVLAIFPVILQYMFWWATGDVSLFGMGYDGGYPRFGLSSSVQALGTYYSIVTNVLPIVYLSYIFHNLVRKQGRIAEFTLPASNVERFTWHALFCLIAPQLVFFLSVLCADVLNLVFAALFGCLSHVESLTKALLFDNMDDFRIVRSFSFFSHPYLVYTIAILSSLCYVSTFALGNAWKYRYNLIFTCLAHVLFWMSLSLVIMFLAGFFMRFVSLDWLMIFDFKLPFDGTGILVLLCVLLLALLVGIWALTYRLYCNAQVTSRRNR